MLFAGEKKGYEVSRALRAKTVREFDTAMSRVSYGFETLEEFYAAASSASKVSNVQVPLLCIQVSFQLIEASFLHTQGWSRK